ncbi:uncharacterized protein LOC143921955 [Arctopsyche grandis]|uniref:uncharacterized protein LOC143921955 n=1 Tax=Arctopsyche grandis TaxID=121162 RepID=UPI00406D83BC
MVDKILFLDLCKELEKISKTTKRLEIQSILSQFFKIVKIKDPNSLSSIVFLCNASLYPEYLNTEMGIGEHIIQQAISEGTGLSVKTIKQKFVKSGDYGVIAMDNRVNQLFASKKLLTVEDVFNNMKRISFETGKNSTNSKKNLMLQLMNACSPLETKYLIRLFESQLKIGLALQTILISISLAYDESNFTIIKSAYNKHPDFNYLIEMLLVHGIEKLNIFCKITPGIPIKPMLAHPHKNLTKAFSKFENNKFLSEFKYDGERVQIHHFNGVTKVFSRNSEDMTEKFPDITSMFLSEKSFIIDAEGVAFSDGKIMPFQLLSTRKRKNVEKIEVAVCVFAFDIVFFDSKELLDMPLSERREILRSNFSEIESKFQFAIGYECNSVEDIETQFKNASEGNCEGVMLKSLTSTYQPSHRSNSWGKIKKDYLDAVGDSLDLVVVGAFYGKGKRTGNFGGFLLATYNDETTRFEPCCKIGTGFSDESLKLFYDQLSPKITSNPSQIDFNDKSIHPDVWILPHYVWEVKAASLSLSPIYSAGSREKGISLRFPRFLNERTDKKPEDATTSNQIWRMYNESVDEKSDDAEFN